MNFINPISLVTETRNANTMDLDTFTAYEIVTAMNDEDAKLAQAVKPALATIAKIADCVADAFSKGGRLIYIGAGTSGRLGVLDASECPPTFGVPPTQVVGIIAGGDTALRNPVEGAEDSGELCRADLIAHNLSSCDVVVGIAASGTTPYVVGGLEYAKEVGCLTASISCNSGSPVAKAADLAVEVIPGPEVLTGSTRLKSGTVQKMVLNMITTASMVRSGKAYQNLMVDVVQSNEKLNTRAENIVIEATGVTREVARKKIDEAVGKVKTAIVMILLNCDKTQAASMLEVSKGHVREAVARGS